MIKQLFQAKVLGTLVLTIFLVCSVSNVNELKAQVQDDEIESPKLNPSEMAEFEAKYVQLTQEIKDNSSYSESEKAIRLKYYDVMQNKVNTGYGIADAIEVSIEPTREYAERLRNGDQVNFLQIVQQAEQRFL